MIRNRVGLRGLGRGQFKLERLDSRNECSPSYSLKLVVVRVFPNVTVARYRVARYRSLVLNNVQILALYDSSKRE
jgi:hypothetical protein